MRRGNQNHRKIDGLWQCIDRQISSQPEYLALAAGHRKNAAVITMPNERVRQPASQGLGVGGGADDCEAVRGEERFQIRHELETSFTTEVGRDAQRALWVTIPPHQSRMLCVLCCNVLKFI